MTDLNHHRIEGNLGDDPKHFNDPGKTEMATFSAATTLQFKNGSGEDVEETEWHRVVAFGWWATIAKDFRKGDRVYIEGYSRTRAYQKNGQDIYLRELVVQRLHQVPKLAKVEKSANPVPKSDSSTTPPNGAPAAGLKTNEIAFF